MAITGQWKRDKVKSLSAFEDYDLIYFGDVTYIDKAQTIPAVFPNFVPGDIVSQGALHRPLVYDDSIPSTIENYPNQLYKDSNVSNRIFLRVESGFDGELGGNIGGIGSLIKIEHAELNGTFRIWKSTLIRVSGTTTTVPGEIWLCSTTDDPEYGVNWQNAMEFANDIDSSWTQTIEGWTDTDITINKAKFWSRDSMVPSE
jgi:hypothetical protein